MSEDARLAMASTSASPPSARMPALARSRSSQGLTLAASHGKLELQVCSDCDAVQYPPRAACHRCLSLRLVWRLQSGLGELIAETTLAHSQEEYFRLRLPWRIGMVRLDAGPTLIVHLHGRTRRAPSRVRVIARLDTAGQAALIGIPEQEDVRLADDAQLRPMTCDPRARKVLVTDGRTAIGQALVRALAAAGADLIWIGHAGPMGNGSGIAELAKLKPVRLLPLDPAQPRSAQDLAAQIGAQLDILINDAAFHQGLMQAFVPAMQARKLDVKSAALAWVNLLPSPASDSSSAPGGAAATSALVQSLREQLRPAGIRVINVSEDSSGRRLDADTQAAGWAAAIVTALQEGIEDIHCVDGRT